MITTIFTPVEKKPGAYESATTPSVATQRTKHDVDVDISVGRMPECIRQCADNSKTKMAPKTQRWLVRRDNKVKLHGVETKPPRFAQAVFRHRAANAKSARTCRNHKGGVGDMRTGAGLIRFQNVGADNFPVLFGDVRLRAGANPICKRVFARDLRIERIGIAGRDDRVENIPDGVVIFICRWSNVQHRLN